MTKKNKPSHIALVVLAEFILIIGIMGTGAIGSLIRNSELYLFGITYYWINIWVMLFLPTLFLKKVLKKKARRFLYTILFILIGIDLLVCLFLHNSISMETLNEQFSFTKGNVNDWLGIIQATIIAIFKMLFSTVGVVIIALLIIGLGLFRIFDMDKHVNNFFASATNFFSANKDKKKSKKSKKSESHYDDFDDEYDFDDSLNEHKKGTVINENGEVVKKSVFNNKALKPNWDFFKKSDIDNIPKEEDYLNKPLKGESILESDFLTKNKEEINEPKFTRTKPKRNLDLDPAPSPKPTITPVPITPSVPKVTEPKPISGVKSTRPESSNYILPPVNILQDADSNISTKNRLKQEAEQKGEELIAALNMYKLNATISNIFVGPTITKYELQPEMGTKVSRFASLGNDLAMTLAAPSIRIEAPIPGKPLIGIEVPNNSGVVVGLKELLESPKNDWNEKLTVALGEGITGTPAFLDITTTPHMLVSGSTGSGKSVCINTIILSILFKARPDEVQLLLIDPKKVELTPYDGVPNLMRPVITNAEEAAVALNKLVQQMTKRYEQFTEYKVKNIVSYNQKMEKEGGEKMPYIVAIIDELSDLMMVASSEVETAIARLAQMARAAGIHLIIATQRPSTDVITGLIKSNIPTRIAFMVSSSIDSRTILDKTGAEKLLGRGDMLLSRNGGQSFERIQGCYVSDDEINEVVELVSQNEIPEEEKFNPDFLDLEEHKGESTLGGSSDDPLLDEALDIAITSGKISTSLLQRRLRIGYNRAANLIDLLEEKQYISAADGNKPRKILMENIDSKGMFDDEL